MLLGDPRRRLTGTATAVWRVVRGGGLFGGDDCCMVDLARWVASLDAVVELIAGRFEPHRWVRAYLRRLLAGGSVEGCPGLACGRAMPG